MSNVEIALATFQSEKFLRAQLVSLFSQSYQDFSILVADDGSTDATLGILAEFATTYPGKIRILEFESRAGGACQNFGRILDHARSDYVMFCDHDDVWLGNKIELTLSRMNHLESNFGTAMPILVHTDLSVVGPDLNPLFSSFFRHEGLFPASADLRRLLMQNNVTGCTVLLNRALYEMARPIPHDAPMHDWWVALVAAAFGKVDFVAQSTILYRQHGKNSVGVTKQRSIVGQIFRFVNFLRGRTAGGRGRLLRVTHQAKLFKDRYASSLPPRQYILISELANLWAFSAAKRVWLLLRNRFFAFRLTRTAELLIAAFINRSSAPP